MTEQEAVANLVQQMYQQQQLFQQQLAQLTAQMTAVPHRDDRESSGRRDERRDELDDKSFINVPKFGGVLAEWDDWRHQLLMGCHRQPDLPKAMKDVMRQAGVSTDVKDITLDPDVKRRFSLTLYRQLSLLTTGEALTVVRSVEDKFADQCGFGALALLSQRFNPKTPARALQQWASVLDPPRVKDVRLLQRTIEEWESRRGKLKSEFGEDVSDNLSIAILTRMLPRDIQDMVYQLGRAGEKLVYQDVRDKVMGIASNRSHELMPTPMDVGCMEGGRADGGAEWQGQNDQEIDAIRGQCYNCQGWGHAAHECPSKPVKGKGKAKGDSSKGSGKGVSSGKGGGGKSGGKGGELPGQVLQVWPDRP